LLSNLRNLRHLRMAVSVRSWDVGDHVSGHSEGTKYPQISQISQITKKNHSTCLAFKSAQSASSADGCFVDCLERRKVHPGSLQHLENNAARKAALSELAGIPIVRRDAAAARRPLEPRGS
jgi:hypothetical protein